MTASEAVSAINAFIQPGTDTANDLSLKLPRMRHFLSLLGNPHRQYNTIHVGGTSGKGSTATLIASILQTAGYRVGLHTQPYLEKFTEKININGRPIDDAFFVALVEETLPVVETLRESTFGLGSGFYFQLATALAFKAFADARVDYGVIEVGMGGEFDPTNVIQPEVSVLTNVSLDHTRFLGETVEEIAATKAGIIKPGVPVISAATQPSVKKIIREKAANVHAPTFFYGEAFRAVKVHVSVRGSSFHVILNRHFGGEGMISLLGRHQVVNAACAIMAVSLLKENIPHELIKKGVRGVKVPGRFEIIRKNPTIVLDVAHNPEKMKSVAQTLKDIFPKKRVVTVVGLIEGHQPEETLAPLRAVTDKFIITEPRVQGKTAVPADVLAAFLPDAIQQKDYRSALKIGLSLVAPNDILLITGSFYLVGPLRSLLLN